MHAEDDRYARFFLFTEKEVEVLVNEAGNNVRPSVQVPDLLTAFL